jgi:hypothetical protein
MLAGAHEVTATGRIFANGKRQASTTTTAKLCRLAFRSLRVAFFHSTVFNLLLSSAL